MKLKNYLNERSTDFYLPEFTDWFLDYYEGSKGYEDVNPETAKNPVQAENKISEIEEKLKFLVNYIAKMILNKVESEDKVEDTAMQVISDWARKSKNKRGIEGDLAKLLSRQKPRKEMLDTLMKHSSFKREVSSAIERNKMKQSEELMKTIQKDFSKGNYSEFQSEIDKGVLVFSTRLHGDISTETPGKEDIRKAKKLAQEIQRKYKNVDTKVDTVDEFTEVVVKMS